MKLSKAFAAVLLLVLVFALVGCSGGSGSTSNPPSSGTTTVDKPAAGATVLEKGFAFEPATLEVKVGDIVTFKNEDSAPHNVSIDGKQLGNQDQGASVTWTAQQAGTFPYTCTIHPAMTGEVVVK
jgi:plastocyanin